MTVPFFRITYLGNAVEAQSDFGTVERDRSPPLLLRYLFILDK